MGFKLIRKSIECVRGESACGLAFEQVMDFPSYSFCFLCKGGGEIIWILVCLWQSRFTPIISACFRRNWVSRNWRWQDDLFVYSSLFIWLRPIFIVARGNLTAVCWLSSCRAAHRLSCPKACGILVPRPGIKPASPALAGGFLTTGPPGKSLSMFINSAPFHSQNSPRLDNKWCGPPI